MNDFERFEQLVEAGSYCISIATQEERYALEIVRKTATKLKRDMWVWSVAEGVRDGLIDSTDKLPEVVKAYARLFELSFPDEKELQQIIRATLQRLRRKKPIEIGITQKGFDTIVRNLRGLTRRQAARIISDAVAADQRFGDEDINVIIANKRRMIQQSDLLEYVQTPLDLSEIGD